jgi:hypothetical protein
MTDRKYLAWTSFFLFLLNVGLILLLVLASSFISDYIDNSLMIIYVIGSFSILAVAMGFLSFKLPQAKVGAIGGLVLLLLVMFIIPVGRTTSITSSQPKGSFQEQPDHTGIADIDTVIDIVLNGNPKDEFQLLQFTKMACTHTEGLGGPPKCKEGEAEGTKIEVFPFLGPEGHHMRYENLDTWNGIPATGLYAVYRVSSQVYSDEYYPAGEYAIVFLTDREELLVTLQVTNGKIVRIDNSTVVF